jgi:2-dehydropantoate 2-reductase
MMAGIVHHRLPPAMSPVSATPLKVTVMGAGAVGCYFGGMLARAGHAVTLVARPQHVAAIRSRGLRMETKAFDEQVRLDATADAAGARDADLVLFCVKSMDTEAAGAQIQPYLRPDTLVLCLQNGVDNADRLRAVLPGQAVAAAVVYVGTEMAGPGHLKHHGRGELVIDPARGSERVVQALAAAGVPTETSPNVRGALWLKLILNCAYNAVSAIAQRPYGENVASAGIPEVMRDVVDECLAVARAEGVQVPGDVDVAVRNIAASMPSQFSSTAQDLARGKPSEIDYLNGFVTRRGQALGVATPANRVLWALVKLIEGKGAAAGGLNDADPAPPPDVESKLERDAQASRKLDTPARTNDSTIDPDKPEQDILKGFHGG